MMFDWIAASSLMTLLEVTNAELLDCRVSSFLSFLEVTKVRNWVPAFAGMTTKNMTNGSGLRTRTKIVKSLCFGVYFTIKWLLINITCT